MADPQTPHAPDSGARPMPEARARSQAGREVSEPRSFATDAADAGAKAAEAGAQVAEAGARSTASAAAAAGEALPRAAGEVARTAAEATRNAGELARNTADSWRAMADPFFSMRVDLARWVDDVWRQTAGLTPLSMLQAARSLSPLTPASVLGLPPVDFAEVEGAYQLTAELPGLTPEEVHLEVCGDHLLLKGEKQVTRQRGEGAYRLTERSLGRFERRFAIPDDVDRDQIDARIENGLLHVTLPRRDRSQAADRRIGVKAASEGPHPQA